ncbi:MAG: hypothetical protein MUC49_15515 [Raineya sp.]|jgi:hypothetical protein|nr:hypothetical protein [Raineya sp.]
MPHTSFVEFPAGSMPREKVRQLHRYLKKHPDTKNSYVGLTGRKIEFTFETKEGAEIFMKDLQAMFNLRNTQTITKEEYVSRQ